MNSPTPPRSTRLTHSGLTKTATVVSSSTRTATAKMRPAPPPVVRKSRLMTFKLTTSVFLEMRGGHPSPSSGRSTKNCLLSQIPALAFYMVAPGSPTVGVCPFPLHKTKLARDRSWSWWEGRHTGSGFHGVAILLSFLFGQLEVAAFGFGSVCSILMKEGEQLSERDNGNLSTYFDTVPAAPMTIRQNQIHVLLLYPFL